MKNRTALWDNNAWDNGITVKLFMMMVWLTPKNIIFVQKLDSLQQLQYKRA